MYLDVGSLLPMVSFYKILGYACNLNLSLSLSIDLGRSESVISDAMLNLASAPLTVQHKTAVNGLFVSDFNRVNIFNECEYVNLNPT